MLVYCTTYRPEKEKKKWSSRQARAEQMWEKFRKLNSIQLMSVSWNTNIYFAYSLSEFNLADTGHFN